MASNEELAALLSKQAGELSALTAALFAICLQTDPHSQIATAIEYHLEQNYSQQLQGMTNQAFFEGYERLMDLLKTALHSEPVG